MKKKYIASVVAVSACAATLAGCSSDDSKTSAKGYVDSSSLTVCVNAQYPPMEYKNSSGQLTGFDMDLAKAVAKQMKKELKTVDVSLAGIIPALNAGRCDAAWSSLYVTPQRSSAATPVGYLRTGYTVLAQADGPKISSLADMAGLRLAYQTGSADEPKLTALQDYLKQHHLKPVEAIGTPAGDDVVQNLLNGKAQAAFQTDVSTGDTLKKTNGKLKLAYTYPTDNTIGVYLNKGSSVVGDLTSAIKSVKESGESAKIAGQYGIKAGNLLP